MNINGRNTLACLCYIEPKGEEKKSSGGDVMKIYPLPHMYVVKDLVPDMGNCEFWFVKMSALFYWTNYYVGDYHHLILIVAFFTSCVIVYEQYRSIEPWLQTKEGKAEGQAEFLQTREDRAKLDGMVSCIR